MWFTWHLPVSILHASNPILSQRQIDVNPIFIFNQNATSVWRHVQRQPDVT